MDRDHLSNLQNENEIISIHITDPTSDIQLLNVLLYQLYYRPTNSTSDHVASKNKLLAEPSTEQNLNKSIRVIIPTFGMCICTHHGFVFVPAVFETKLFVFH